MNNLECRHQEPGLERFCRKCGAPVSPSAPEPRGKGPTLSKDPDELTGNGIGAVFVGDGFLIVGIILSATQTPVSSILWLLLLIPAFFFFGKGFSDLLQARQIRRRIEQDALDVHSADALPSESVIGALKRTISGELVLPSVTERTTRDLK
jgi:hypothetical protein